MLVKRIAACSHTHLSSTVYELARYWSEIATFSYPLYLAPQLGVIPLDDLRDFWWVSYRMAKLQYGAKIFPKS